MNTSYYAKYKGENAVSISIGTPTWFKGRQYKKLCPPWSLVDALKLKTISQERFEEWYDREVLSKLDAQTVYDELGADSIMMCWEKSSDFCHRHLVSKWFKKELGIEVIEL